MTWILMEIPCHFISQIDGSLHLVQIHTKCYDYSMSFIQVLFASHAGTLHGFWASSSHGISMAFSKKMMGFPIRIWGHFPPNCHQKDMRKSLSHFLQGCYYNIFIIMIISYENGGRIWIASVFVVSLTLHPKTFD